MMRILLLLLMTLPGLAMADSGRILYVTGQVTVERGGKLYRAVKNARVVEGDTISTSATGRLHIRMSDRTLLSLKPDTRFTIESYRHAAARSTSTPGSSSASGDRSVFGLLKGGFRAITGLIGQRDKSAFSVNTPVATIGIRGTSFVADLQVPDNQQAAADDLLNPQRYVQLAQAGAMQPGTLAPPDDAGQTRLTVGVGDGAVILSNAGGSLVLENGEFGQVTAQSRAPQRLLRPVPDEELENASFDDEDLSFSSDDDTQTQLGLRTMPGSSDPAGGSDAANNEAEETVPQDSEPLSRRNLAYASALQSQGSNATALTLADQATLVDSNGDVVGFVTGIDNNGQVEPVVVQLDHGQIVNRGADPQTGLTWGRWSGEAVSVTNAAGESTSLSTEQLNLHMVQSDSSNGSIAVPITGSREFTLVGNTDPTSSTGATGFLGHAALSANFDTQRVASSLSLSVDQQNWQAQGQGQLGAGLGSGTPEHLFGGTYSSVRVDGVAGGQGQFSGFFTDQAGAAGLSYALQNNGESVHGSAAFEAASP
ncbi:MAG: hypothetical protein EVA65_03215 [Oceanococcus sp.]|nr:MAG: hypothetical protein EVA65_03215 [Oceanococcus sp.]